VDNLLRPYGGLGAYGRADQTSNRVISDELAQIRSMAGVLPVIFVSISAFLLHIVLLRLTATQRTQIAVLKAFGYTNLSVGAHYVLYALVPGVLGAGLGLVAGAWLGSGYTGLYSEVFRFPELDFHTSWQTAGIAVLLSLAACLTGALSAVRAAVRLQPAQVMRGPAPPTFRPLAAERFRVARFNPTQRMILRNLERRPLRALFATASVGFALALMLVGFAMFDSVRAMMALQFGELQQEDVAVAFAGQRPVRAARELARLPGVIATEPIHTVAIRLKHEQRSELLPLTGITGTGRLRVLRTAKQQRRAPPEDGIALTDRVAQQLRVGAGDTLTLELLERPGVERTVLVRTLIDETIGINAYMEWGALHRLLQQAPTLTGALLRVERNAENDVLRRVREFSAVQGATSKSALLRSFDEQVARSTRVTMTILIVLSVILGVGVIYNGARIALSERGVELATLRVLGFSNAEVADLLLGEQALITAAGIPLGWLLG
jgi:putative ABC transport system permease protein